MTFGTVYQISIINETVLEGLFFFLSGAIFGVVGLKKSKGVKRIFVATWTLVWCSLTGIWFFGSLAGSYRYADMLSHDKADVTEGVVTVEHVQPAEGHSSGDKVRIGKKMFEVDYYTTKVGYTKSISHGGCLTEGAYARVYYRDDNILRIDIRR